MSHRTNTLRLARGNTARPFTGTALDVTLRACDRDVPEPVYRLARPFFNDEAQKLQKAGASKRKLSDQNIK